MRCVLLSQLAKLSNTTQTYNVVTSMHIVRRWKGFHSLAPLPSTTWIEKPLGLFWLFRPSTKRKTLCYTTTSITVKTVVDKLKHSWATVYEEYCQNAGQKNLPQKKPRRDKSRREISVGSMAHALNNPSYEGYKDRRSLSTFTKHVFQQSTVNSKLLFENRQKITKTS